MLAALEQILIGLLLMVVCKVSDGHVEPRILSLPEVFRSHIGSDVRLPCNVTQLSDGVLLWKQGSRIIYAGDIKVRRDDRFALDGTSLVIHDLTGKDDGEYTCELETKDKNNPRWITHKVLVLQRPQIFTAHSQANLTVIKGSSVVLHCGARGNPRPSIIWTKKNRDLAGLEHSVSSNGSSLSLHNITTSHAGSYMCTADNGVGNPVSEEVLLTVLYPPSAVAERGTVLGGEGCSVELACMVEGFPTPSVHWYQGTMKLVSNNNIRISQTGGRHQLSFIRFSFKDKDEMEIGCSASSPLGQAEAKFDIEGTPGLPVIMVNVTEVESSRYKIVWTTPSFTNIAEHLLIYKQVKDEKSPSLLTYGENKLKIPNMRVQHQDCSRKTQPFKHAFEFVLDKLEPTTRYQVRLQARNVHGWSQVSDPIVFKTSQYLVHPPQESPMLPLSGAVSHKNPFFIISFKMVGVASTVIMLTDLLYINLK